MSTVVYATPGNLGILSKKLYLFTCGGGSLKCWGSFELNNHTNLGDAKSEARSFGWENGYREGMCAMPGAQGFSSTWRCPECRGYA